MSKSHPIVAGCERLSIRTWTLQRETWSYNVGSSISHMRSLFFCAVVHTRQGLRSSRLVRGRLCVAQYLYRGAIWISWLSLRKIDMTIMFLCPLFGEDGRIGTCHAYSNLQYWRTTSAHLTTTLSDLDTYCLRRLLRRLLLRPFFAFSGAAEYGTADSCFIACLRA